MTEARVVIEDFRHRYNHFRPHSKLGYQSPVRFAQQLTPSPAPVGLRPPCAGDGQNRADGKLGGTYRSKMTKPHLKQRGYGRRWGIESFFSGLKRTTGSDLLARTETNLLHEAALPVLAYTLNRR